MPQNKYSIPRDLLLKKLGKATQPNKITIIYGPRQVGKTTILKEYLSKQSSFKMLNAEIDLEARLLRPESIEQLKDFLGTSQILAIDEAQHIKDIDVILKIIVDNIEDIHVIVTGSSSLDLSNLINEPLTGRKNVIKIFPIAQLELSSIEDSITSKGHLKNRLIYGSYPEILTLNDNEDKRDRISEIVNTGYLWKDILKLTNIKNADKLGDILRLLAYQIGKSVSLTEIGGKLGLDKNTIDSYIDLLQKTFIIYEQKPYSSNPRTGITKLKRYYFYDNGVRNALIDNFKAIDLRDGNDIGMLWENYIVSERMKMHEYKKTHTKSYFWRLGQQEIDLIEEKDGDLNTLEVKWGNKKAKVPSQWDKNFSYQSFQVINPENYLEFIT